MKRGRPPLEEKKERPKRIFDSFKVEDRLEIKLEHGGILEIQLKANDVRVFKIEYFLNGHLLKPENWQGKHKAYKRWSELKCSLIENSKDFKGLTPEA